MILIQTRLILEIIKVIRRILYPLEPIRAHILSFMESQNHKIRQGSPAKGIIRKIICGHPLIFLKSTTSLNPISKKNTLRTTKMNSIFPHPTLSINSDNLVFVSPFSVLLYSTTFPMPVAKGIMLELTLRDLLSKIKLTGIGLVKT